MTNPPIVNISGRNYYIAEWNGIPLYLTYNEINIGSKRFEKSNIKNIKKRG